MELKAQKRAELGKGVQALRDEGKLPAVMYGAKDASVSIAVDAKDFAKVFKNAGESTIVELVVDSEKKNVLIHDIDHDPVTSEPRHVDFYVVQKGQKVEVEIPLVFVGEAPGVRELGANLIKALHEVEIEGDATNLPHELTVDVSSLVSLESHITAKDSPLPAGVTLITDPEESVASLAMPEEEPEEPAEAPDMDSIGISEERGKKEEAGADDETKKEAE